MGERWRSVFLVFSADVGNGIVDGRGDGGHFCGVGRGGGKA